MKRALVIVLFLVGASVKGQSLIWEWARQGNCSVSPHENGEGYGVAVDYSENIYITGFYADTIYFGSYTFIDPQPLKPLEYLVKYDSTGNLIWAKSTSGTAQFSPRRAKNLAVDIWGNIYLTGEYFSGTAVFDTHVLGNAYKNFYLAKYDSSGTVMWALSGDTSASSASNGVVTDVWGNVYITGTFTSKTFQIGPTILTNADTNGVEEEIFIAKYDSSGNSIWAKSARGKWNDYSLSITCDSAGSVYISGNFNSDTLVFDGDTVIKSTGGVNFFIAKYDSSGNALWARSAGANNGEVVGISAVAKSKEIYVTGTLSDTVSFGSFTLLNQGFENIFVVKYDSSGNVIWAKNSIGCIYCSAYSLDVDSLDNVFVSAGLYQSDTARFDNFTLYPVANAWDPMFIVKYNSSGQAQWALELISGGDDDNCIAVGHSNTLYATGDFVHSPLILGNDTLFINDSTQELPFVAKLLCDFPLKVPHDGIHTFVIYPNPTTSTLTLETNSTNPLKQLIIYSADGREIKTVNCQLSTVNLDVSDLSAGIYFFNCIGEKGSEMVKVVKY